MHKKDKGFTLLEVLIVIGIIAVLSAAVLVAVNPTRQFKIARDSQRVANVSAIANAIAQNMSEHQGSFECAVAINATPKTISSTQADIGPCLVPDYIAALPFDPSVDGAHYTPGDYDTGYTISINTSNRIVVSATGELKNPIEAIR